MSTFALKLDSKVDWILGLSLKEFENAHTCPDEIIITAEIQPHRPIKNWLGCVGMHLSPALLQYSDTKNQAKQSAQQQYQISLAMGRIS